MRSPLERTRFYRQQDALRLLLCVGGSWSLSLLMFALIAPQVLNRTIHEAMGHALSRQSSQLRGGSRATTYGGAWKGVLHLWDSPEPHPDSSTELNGQAALVQRHLSEDGIKGVLRRVPPSQDSWLGGYWLSVDRNDDPSQRVWVHASPGGALPWLWPSITVSSLLLGGSVGVAIFLRWQLERPIQAVMKSLPAIPSGELELVPEGGMTAMRELSIRINRVLEQLNQQQESRRRFLQGLAHDLGSPLTRLSMRLEKLEDPEFNPQRIPEALPQLRMEINRLIKLTHLLQQASGESMEPFNPKISAVDELCERVAASYVHQEIGLNTTRVLARIDHPLMERALQNLLDNAISYGKAPIQISLEQHRSEMVLAVDDGGPGLKSANLLGMPRIAPAHDRQQSKRSGIGLTVVERCCQLHGGRLQLDRSDLGGLRAELHLPLRG